MDQSNPLEALLAALMGQAQARPDLGQQQPVATMAGRVVGPGDTMGTALSRMPMGSGEGDPMMATLQAAMGPAAQGASSALAAKLIPMLAGAGGFRLQGGPAPYSGGAGVINPSVGGNSVPSDPWGVQRQPATRNAPSMASNVQSPNAGVVQRGSRNPRDVSWTSEMQAEYDKLPQGGRSNYTPEDLRRIGLGETGVGPQMQSRPNVPPAGPTYSLWQELAKALGVQVQ